MSITEAFRRERQPRPTLLSKLYPADNDHAQALLKRGIQILNEASIPTMLSELQELLFFLYPDIRIPSTPNSDQLHTRWADGLVATGIGWGYRKVIHRGQTETQYQEVLVFAEPMTERIVICGQEAEIIEGASHLAGKRW